MSVSLKDIASQLGVSDVAVSLALRDSPRISVDRRKQIKSLAKKLGYRPDPVARAMRTRRTHTIGLLMSNFRTAISNLKMEAIEQQLVASGYRVIVGFTDGNEAPLIDYVENMIAQRVDGLIIHGSHGGEGTWARLQERAGESMPPCVLADARATDAPWPVVGVDRVAGMARLVEHFVGLGHRDLLYVGSTAQALPEKWHGVVRGVADAAEPVRCRWTSLWHEQWYEPAQVAGIEDAAHGGVTHDEFVRLAYEKGRALAARREELPRAILAQSDLFAMALVQGLQDGGLRVPEDVSVSGFDGDETARLIFRPRLTTVRQPQAELADGVTRLLLDLIDGKPAPQQQTLLVPELVTGKSTAPPAAGAAAPIVLAQE